MSHHAAVSLQTLDEFRGVFSAEAVRPGQIGRVLIQNINSITESHYSDKLTVSGSSAVTKKEEKGSDSATELEIEAW